MVSVLSKLFVNLFDDPRITPARFLDFCMFVYDQMSADNKDGKYDKDLVVLEAIIGSLDAEINEVDTSLHTQVNNTTSVNNFIKGFGQFMKRNSGAISYALGGDNTDAFLEFYPYKNEEYLLATRKTMPKLVARVGTLATKYADQLGTKLTGDLQAFSPAYKKVLSAQRTQIGAVSTNREERNTTYEDAQWSLTGVVLSVAAINTRNPAASEKLFDFTMLYPQSKPFVVKAEGKLAAKESSIIVNRTLINRVKMVVVNKSVNADALVWLAMSPTEDAPANANVIKANSKGEIKAADWDSLKGTFLMIKNGSDINEVAYSIEITGLKKTKEEQAAEKEKEAEKERAQARAESAKH